MILSRVKINPQQRYDLEDFFAQLAAARSDSKLYTQKFLSEFNLIMNGFTVSGIGLNQATVGMANACLIIPQNSFDFSYFISAPAEPDVTITDADLVDGARNYVEIELTTQDGVPLTKAFWDPEANSGNGAEFNQIVDTITDLRVSFVVSTGGFSGSPDRLPVAIIDTDGSGVIKVILDRRELYGRLSKPNDLDNEYVWGTKVEPVYQLNMTGVVGVFTDGEQISIGGETATVVTGGGASITFNEPTGINFSNGDTVTGVDSGATGTIDTVLESFSGVDKSLNTEKERFDALATEIKLMKGTRFWWSPTNTLVGIYRFMNSVIAPASTTARFRWTGSALVIEDDNASPAATDAIAYIRLFGNGDDLIMSRQETGQEIQLTEFNEVPTSGAFTLEHNGDISDSINFDDDAAAVQTAINAQWTAQVTVTGTFEDGFKITFDTAGPVVEHTVNSNTLAGPSGAVTITPSTVKNGYAGGTTIPIANGEVLYVKLPASGNRTWADAGAGDTNYQVEDIASYDTTDETRYWIAYREAGSVLLIRGAGELSAGESTAISNNVPQSLLDILGLTDEVTAPAYTSNIRGTQGQSFVDRMSKNTDAIGDFQEDRSGYLRSDDVVTWTGTQVEFTADIELRLENTKSGTPTVHTIAVAGSPIVIADGEAIWVEINRLAASETLAVKRTTVDAIPAQTQDDKDVFILFKRIDAAGVQVLHIPFHKQALDPGQSVRLGASGSGSGSGSSQVAEYLDRLHLSTFKRVSTNIFSDDKATQVDGASTGAFSPAKSAFEFTAAAQTLIDVQNLDPDFLADGLFPRKVELYVKWLAGEIDDAATYELSINGGLIWEAVTMEQVEDTNAFRGILELADPTDSDLQEVPVTDADSSYVLNDGTTESRAQSFDVTNTENIRALEVYINKVGTPLGELLVSIALDDSNAPGAVIATDRISVSDLSAGNNVVAVDIPDTVLPPGTYWIQFSTDAAYKASFSTGVDEIRVQADSSAPALADAQVYNGTIWSTVAGTNLCFLVKGIELDLRVRVTASQASSIASYGVYYDRTPGVTAAGQKKVDRIRFTGDENRTVFNLSFTPHPDFLEILDFYRGQSYFVDNDRIRIDGSTVTFAADFFNFPGEEILLMFRQTDASVIDESADNANKIATIEAQLIDIGDELDSISDSMVLDYIPVPHTQIVGRAEIADLSQDLKARMGKDGMALHYLFKIQGEVGPSNEEVFGLGNDRFGQIRLYGKWVNENSSNGPGIVGQPNSVMEYTFYGTDVDLLMDVDSNARDIKVSVDGGAYGSNIYPSSASSILSGRNYNGNVVVNAVNGLTEGLHTIRVRCDAINIRLQGIQSCMSDSSGNILVNSGSQLYKGRKLTAATQTALPYNSGFETGTLGSKGGCGLEYQKSDGSIAHAVNPTDATALYLTSANHANEQVLRKINWREFGAGRTDDLSLLVASSDKSFTLDDGITTLVGNDVIWDFPSIYGFRNAGSAGSFWTLTFVGTGLDFTMEANGTGTHPYDAIVDGVNQGQIINAFTAGQRRVIKVASGLPFGVHTVKLLTTGSASGGNPHFFDFTVYGPKRPDVPSGAKEKSTYFILADYAQNSGDPKVSYDDGMIFKNPMRETIYTGTHTAISVIASDYLAGIGVANSGASAGDTIEYNFYGTGIQWAFTNSGTGTYTVTIDGVAYTGSATATGGGNSWTPGSSLITVASQGFWTVTGLSLGHHKVVLTKTSTAGNYAVSLGWGIVTPIWSPQYNAPFVMQNALDVGSQGICDLRKFSKKDVVKLPNLSQATGEIINGPPSTSSTTNPGVPLPNIVCPIYTSGGYIDIAFEMSIVNTVTNGSAVSLFLDGENLNPQTPLHRGAGSTDIQILALNHKAPIGPGFHMVMVFWFSDVSGTTQNTDSHRKLFVREVKE